jgi:hypothetical protein
MAAGLKAEVNSVNLVRLFERKRIEGEVQKVDIQ